MHRSIQLSVFGSDSFARDGLKRLLADHGFLAETFSPDRVEDAATNNEDDAPHVVLMDCTDQDSFDACRTVSSVIPDARLALLVNQCSPSEMAEVLATGAAGVLDKACSCASLVNYLKLVALGQRVVSSRFVEHVIAPATMSSPEPVRERRLSEREWMVVQHVAHGLPNKEIARRTGLAEQTVKVHLKAIMRKLKVVNRTQLALRVASPTGQFNA
jgi:two-component system nitrate/nitrite response regulator NarL